MADQAITKLRRRAHVGGVEERARVLLAQVRSGADRTGLGIAARLGDEAAASVSPPYKSRGRVHNEDLECLAGLELDRLELRYDADPVTTVGMKHLLAVPSLTRLHLEWSEHLKDRGLRRLKGLTNLTELGLDACSLVDATLPALLSLPRLRRLQLSHTEITDAGVRLLARATQLTSLTIERASAPTKDALAELAGATHLRELGLQGCQWVLNDHVELLSTMVWLTLLDLSSCWRITDESVERVRAALPRVELVR